MMTKTARDSLAATEAAFHKHYASIWGEARWHGSLYPALAARTRQAALVNNYASREAVIRALHVVDDDQLEKIVLPTSPKSESTNRLILYAHKITAANNTDETSKNSQTLPQPGPEEGSGISARLMTHWNLDAASALAAHFLDVQPGDSVLDLCAAPGGKSIALSQAMWPQLAADEGLGSESKPSHLHSNESDPARFRRLSANLKAYLPLQLFQSKQVVSLNIDSTSPHAVRQLAAGSHGFDRVLVDAPCSSERHIIHAHGSAKAGGRIAPEMANWRPGSSKRLAKTQVELLMTGLRATKVGGRLVYATCSIEPTENDGVVEKMLATVQKESKKGCRWSVKVGLDHEKDDSQLEERFEKWAERTKHGCELTFRASHYCFS
jgi:hypothetical protein